MNQIQIITLIVIYLLIGLRINWEVAPNRRFYFNRYSAMDFWRLFLDTFFWLFIIVAIMLSTLKTKNDDGQ